MKKDKRIIKLDEDISFEEAMRHLATTKKEDVDEVMQASEETEPEVNFPPDEEAYPMR
jgi:hypothetical protein